jgi:hypothetical protein
MMDLRAELDGALGALTLREIRLELGLSVQELSPETVLHLSILFSSEAFLRYLDAYLYFGIRFHASRKPFQATAIQACADGNVRSLPLLTPPTLSGLAECKASVDALCAQQAKDQEEPIRTALLFLATSSLRRKARFNMNWRSLLSSNSGCVAFARKRRKPRPTVSIRSAEAWHNGL